MTRRLHGDFRVGADGAQNVRCERDDRGAEISA
jgi:hypothetical protein